MRILLLALALFGASAGALAADLSHLYSDATLRYWQGRYEPALRSNFNRLVLGSLNPAERRQLGAVRLELPIRAPGEAAGDLLAFYAAGNSIVIPTQSVKFFDDLSLAWAYAWANKLSLEKVTDYVSMLKYQRAPAGGFPPPLDAFGVAEDVWKKDQRIDDVSQKILKSAVVWIVAHELGHLLFKHPGYGPDVGAAQAQANESQADRFANEIMRRIGVAPGGMANFFLMLAHWSANRGDFGSDADWAKYQRDKATHPFTASRMRVIATDLRRSPADFSVEAADRTVGRKGVLFIARQLDQIANILDDPLIQRSIVAKARAMDLAAVSYAPRKGQSTRGAALGPFAGAFQGSFQHRLPDGSSEKLALSLQLERRGERTVGRFDFGLGPGTLEGRVTGNTLRFQWVWGTAFGQGVLAAGVATGIAGTLGYSASDRNAGRWELERE